MVEEELARVKLQQYGANDRADSMPSQQAHILFLLQDVLKERAREEARVRDFFARASQGAIQIPLSPIPTADLDNMKVGQVG